MVYADSRSEDDSRQAGAIARESAAHLIGGRPGLRLIGPETRTALAVRLLLDQLDETLLLPVVIDARGATLDSVRDATARRHAMRSSRETGLLLVVSHAERLSGEMLHEFDQAAEAASQFGGLKILFTQTGARSPDLERPGLTNLARCLSTILALPAVREAAPLVRDPAPAHAPGSAIAVSAAGRNPAVLVLLAMTILAVLCLAVWLLLRGMTGTRPLPAAATSTLVTPPPARILPAPRPVAPPVLAPPQKTVPAPVPPPAPAAMTPGPAALLPPEPMPEPVPVPSSRQGAGTSLLLIAQPGDTLALLYAKVYSGSEPPPFSQVQALNPVVRPGIRLVFPAPSAGWPRGGRTP